MTNLTSPIFSNPVEPASIYKADPYHEKYYGMFEKHQKAHWTKDELTNISVDVRDFQDLSVSEKNLILNILRVFTQADSAVLDGYSHIIKTIKPLSAKMMLGDFLSRECVHIDAYSYFTDNLNLDSDFYSEFLKIPEMNDKFKFIESAKVKPFSYYMEKYENHINLATINYRQDILYMLCVHALLVEGTELFAMFSILFSFRVFSGKMNELATIVEWSIRDESQHVFGNSVIINDIIEAHPELFTTELIERIYGAYRNVVEQEDIYIELLFEHMDSIKGITKEELKQFVRFIASSRLGLIGLRATEEVSNPFPWLNEVLFSAALTNFFSSTVTQYTRGLMGDFTEDTKDSLKQARRILAERKKNI